MDPSDTGTCSDFSSRLPSPLSRSPTPPDNRIMSYPTPPSSQLSSIGTMTPRSDLDCSAVSSSVEDGQPPAKRRRLNSAMPRDTTELDLEGFGTVADEEDQAKLDRLLKALRKKRKIVVIAGAGISVSAGIPDFRSSNGLFKQMKQSHNLKGSGKQLFDAAVYRDAASTSSFHEMVREMSTMSKAAKPSPFHHLLARLAHEGRLLRLYSQNVDGLETSLEPLRTVTPLPTKAPWPKTVQLHGGLEMMVCTKCNTTSDFDANEFIGPIPPFCKACEALDQIRTEVAGKRSHGIGRLRPRMVLYNEANPDDEAIGSCAKADMRTRPDAVIVVGTTLKVPGVRRIVREMCGIVRDRRDGLTVWINRDPAPPGVDLKNCWDLIVKGAADDVAERASLGRWDDPEIPIEAIKEEDVQAAKDRGEPCVFVPPSPSKGTSGKFTMPFDPVADAVETNASAAKVSDMQMAKAKLKAFKVENPASKGKNINQVLGKEKAPAKSAKAGTKGKAAPAKKPAPKRKTPAPATTRNGPTIKLSFGTSKNGASNSTAAAASKGKKKQPETKETPQTPTKKRGSKAMDSISETSPRVNTNLSKARFPNLSPRKPGQAVAA